MIRSPLPAPERRISGIKFGREIHHIFAAAGAAIVSTIRAPLSFAVNGTARFPDAKLAGPKKGNGCSDTSPMNAAAPSCAFETLELIFHVSVRNLRKSHGNAMSVWCWRLFRP
jgi:hypothetical protein